MKPFKYVCRSVLESSLTPYAIPTFGKSSRVNDPNKNFLHYKNKIEEEQGALAHMFAGGLTFASYFIQITLYFLAAEIGHPEALLIPVLTNTASGTYELIKGTLKKKMNLESRVIG